jgi:tetratricopeptide (TPR) repeat protein
MELTASTRHGALARSRRLTARLDAPAVAAWTLGFTVVAYLALSNGGYDTVVRSQVGIAVWWIVLLGALAGVLPARIGAAGWTAIGLLAGFALWTGLAIGWSESAERSTIELGRVAAYLGVLVLAIALQGRTAARHMINGLACAIGLVTLLAVLSRLHPQWFPANDHFEFLGSARKLSYPLNYWNALAAFAAIGVPLLLGLALAARTLVGQAVAAAALPLSALCIYLTISRGGALALVVGILVFVLFVPHRVAAVGTLLVSGAGGAILVSAASQRDALQDGIVTSAATQQGTELMWLAAIVCAGVGLVQVAMGLSARHFERPAVLRPGRRATVVGALALVAVLCALGVAAGAPGWAHDQWKEFTAPPGSITGTEPREDDVFGRLSGVNGNGRYQYWQAALDANETAPLKGIGPGTFEFWWARHGNSPAFIRDAHTLYFETLAETGIVGAVLLGGLLAFLLVVAVTRSLRATPTTRMWIAAAVGALAAFMTSAAFEWVWEMAAIAVIVMLLGAVVVAGRDADDGQGRDAPVSRDRSVAARAIIALIAAAALGAIAVPMAAALTTRESRDAAADGRLVAALEDIRTAQRIQPYAATPHLQRALVLEEAGNLRAGASAARVATAKEPTNWRTWFVLARIDARRGNAPAALAALRRAKQLNPRSPLLGGP